MTVTPNTGLVDRQVVTVTLTGWPALGTVPWCQGIQHTPEMPDHLSGFAIALLNFKIQVRVF